MKTPTNQKTPLWFWVALVCYFAFLIAVALVAYHFISKWW